MISWEEFEKLDMRIGTIVEAMPFEKAKKPAYKLTIDFGKEGIKNSSAQITTLYNCDEIIGKQIIAVINFPPKQIADYMSECLVLGVYDADNNVILLQPERHTANGNKIG